MNDGQYRLFFAVYPERVEREQLDQAASQSIRAIPGHLVPLDNLHMTLVFLGQCSASDLAYLEGG